MRDAPVFGYTVPCRSCLGSGTPQRAMTKEEKQERRRQQRSGTAEPLRCFECDGRGFLPISDADRRMDDRPDSEGKAYR